MRNQKSAFLSSNSTKIIKGNKQLHNSTLPRKSICSLSTNPRNHKKETPIRPFFPKKSFFSL